MPAALSKESILFCVSFLFLTATMIGLRVI
jgi:hypothetical protein